MDLTKYLGQYSYFLKFTDFIFRDLAYEIRRRGYLEKEDFILILLWKRQLFQLNLDKGEWRVPIRKENQGKTDKTIFSFEADEMKIQKVTKKIFSINHLNDAEIVGILEELSSLRGVKPKTATAILAVVFPDLYGVVDIHVENQLEIHHREDSVKEKAKNCAKIIFELRKIAHEQMEKNGRYWTPRMVDMALFVLDQQQPPDRELEEEAEMNERSELYKMSFPELEDEDEHGEEDEDRDEDGDEENADEREKDLPDGYESVLYPDDDVANTDEDANDESDE
jgi:hypothetical protein